MMFSAISRIVVCIKLIEISSLVGEKVKDLEY